MPIENAEILRNSRIKDEYYQVVFNAPEIAKESNAGQFVHIQIATLKDRLLRRPFSICNTTNEGTLTVVYKVVGKGTEVLSTLNPGTVCSLMGALGSTYSHPKENEFPVIAVGGYGAAATYLLAKKSKNKGVLLIGARSSTDLILIDRYRELGYEVKISTEDGSEGHKGLVTELFAPYLKASNNLKPRFYGCGPNGMMIAMAKILADHGIGGEVSLDHEMCCGVGACYTCVVKIKEKENNWKYSRACKEGPVFDIEDLYFD